MLNLLNSVVRGEGGLCALFSAYWVNTSLIKNLLCYNFCSVGILKKLYFILLFLFDL